MTQTLTIEMAPFVLADGVTDETLLQASERLERDFLSQLDGYLGRILVKRDSHGWADIVFWESPEQAAKAMEAAACSAACGSYFKCMVETNPDDPHHGVTLFRSIKTYGSISV